LLQLFGIVEAPCFLKFVPFVYGHSLCIIQTHNK
jgi:hypothetical protein